MKGGERRVKKGREAVVGEMKRGESQKVKKGIRGGEGRRISRDSKRDVDKGHLGMYI